MRNDDDLRRERRIGWIAAAILVPLGVVLYVMLRFVVTNHMVPTGSMIPTVHPRDRVVVNRLAYAFGEKPRAGDVVAYRQDALFLHRIVAGPDDTIEMRDNVVFVNGKRRHEPYTIITPDVPAVRTFGPVTIPPEHYFLMGDNRDNANDSRFRGFIAEEEILGRMIHVFHIGRCDE
jgi:signal peptidase I